MPKGRSEEEIILRASLMATFMAALEGVEIILGLNVVMDSPEERVADSGDGERNPMRARSVFEAEMLLCHSKLTR